MAPPNIFVLMRRLPRILAEQTTFVHLRATIGDMDPVHRCPRVPSKCKNSPSQSVIFSTQKMSRLMGRSSELFAGQL